MQATTAQKDEKELEDDLIERIARLTFIIGGLDGHEPFEEVIRMFSQTRKTIDDNWHLVSDPAKLSELRMTKMAVNTLIDFIPNLKVDKQRLQDELMKIQNPDDIINKDYDPN